MRIKTRIKQLEIANKHLLSKDEPKIGFRVVEGKRVRAFRHTRLGVPYANFLALNNLEHHHQKGLIDSMSDVCGLDVDAQAKEIGFFKNSSGEWETRPDIEYEFLKRFLEEDHRRLGNDPHWIKSLRERLVWLEGQL